jgi:hypothetical protein
MVTYKSLIVSFALILALIGTGVLAMSAQTLASAQQQHNALPYQDGIAAISVATSQHRQVSFQDVRHYLKSKGFAGGPTLTGRAPKLKNLQLTDINRLGHLLHLLLPQLPGNKAVYYAQLEGPFILLPQIPLPTLATLVPGAPDLPTSIPKNLVNLGLASSPLGLLPVRPGSLLPVRPGSHKTSNLPGFLRMPDLSNLQSGSGAPTNLHPSKSQSHNMSKKEVGTVIPSAYEVFDADNGNLLAWGKPM